MGVNAAERRYAVAEPFIFEVRKRYRAGWISWQQAKTLKGQALAGDLAGARKGLDKLIYKGAQTHAETSGKTDGRGDRAVAVYGAAGHMPAVQGKQAGAGTGAGGDRGSSAPAKRYLAAARSDRERRREYCRHARTADRADR